MGTEPKRWLKLDNAAKIYPPAMRRDWMAMFRFSAELTEPVEPELLGLALECVLPRFPGFTVHLRRGLFWYYLEHSDEISEVQEDVGNPCVRIDLREKKRFLFRVRYYSHRIAVEMFHALTDGTGGLCFLNTLVAEYLRIKYSAVIPRNEKILDCTEAPRPAELEDSFLKYAGGPTHSRREDDAFHVPGDPEPPDVVHITTGIIPVSEVLSRAKEKGVSLTEYLAAVMIMSIDTIQRRIVKRERKLRPVKVCLPVNLRSFFPSETLRNFSLYINPGIEPRLGRYSFDEILKTVHHHMGSQATEKNLRARFAANVQSEKWYAIRVTPLFLKNIIMRAVYDRLGDRKISTTLTNLGRVVLPEEMSRYVRRMDVILGPLTLNRVICAVLSYGETLQITFTRTIKDSAVEREMFRNLVRLGIHVKVESNNQW